MKRAAPPYRHGAGPWPHRPAAATDLGTLGPTYEIAEPHLLDA